MQCLSKPTDHMMELSLVTDRRKLENSIAAKAAMASTGDILPVGAPRLSDTRLTQEQRAKASGISRRSQQMLDQIAIRSPTLLKSIEKGEISIYNAAKKAGVVRAKTELDRAQEAFLKLAEPDRNQFLNWLKDHMGSAD